MTQEEPLLVRKLSGLLVVLTVLALAMAFIVFGLYVFQFGDLRLSLRPEIWAQFGDYVGGLLGAIFSLLAFLALIITLRVQAYEISLSTRELKNSALALAEQGNYLKRQIFENTFFQLIKTHTDILSSIDVRDHGEVVATGRDCLRIYYRRLSSRLRSVQAGDFIDPFDGFQKIYSEHFDHYESDLGHYFRHLYRIVKFVDESDVSDKRSYVGIVRAQLSSDELAYIFFNGIGEYGEKFRILIEKYSLLENLRPENVPLWDELNGLYAESAFGGTKAP